MTKPRIGAPDTWSLGASIYEWRQELAEAAANRHLVDHADPAFHGIEGREAHVRHHREHLEHLAQAVALAEPGLYLHYIAWLKVLLNAHGVSDADIRCNLVLQAEVLGEALPGAECELALFCIEQALSKLSEPPATANAKQPDDQPLAATARQYLDHLLAGDRERARALVLDRANCRPEAIREMYRDVFRPVQQRLGRLWQTNQISIAQEHFCTATTRTLMAQLQGCMPHANGTRPAVVAACLEEEAHDLGLRMVADILDLEGWTTHYLGAGVPRDAVLQALAEREADVLALSVTMSHRIWRAAEVIGKVRADPRLQHVNVIVGGQSLEISPSLWRWIGADASARSGEEAVERIREFMAG